MLSNRMLTYEHVKTQKIISLYSPLLWCSCLIWILLSYSSNNIQKRKSRTSTRSFRAKTWSVCRWVKMLSRRESFIWPIKIYRRLICSPRNCTVPAAKPTFITPIRVRGDIEYVWPTIAKCVLNVQVKKIGESGGPESRESEQTPTTSAMSSLWKVKFKSS